LDIKEFDGTANSAFAWGSTEKLDGWRLIVKNVGTWWVHVNRFGQASLPPPDPCAFAFNWISLVTNTDGSIGLAYADNVAGGKTKTATMAYCGM
jgi:hypothetical protein